MCCGNYNIVLICHIYTYINIPVHTHTHTHMQNLSFLMKTSDLIKIPSKLREIN